MSHPAHDFMNKLMRDFGHTEVPIQKWEFWTNGRRRSQTICITLSAGIAGLTIAHRAIGTDGCSSLNAFSCDIEHLPKLIYCLTRALAVAREHGLIKHAHRRK